MYMCLEIMKKQHRISGWLGDFIDAIPTTLCLLCSRTPCQASDAQDTLTTMLQQSKHIEICRTSEIQTA